jgi:hypothetical protein
MSGRPLGRDGGGGTDMGLFSKKQEPQQEGFIWQDAGLPEGVDESLFQEESQWQVQCAWCLLEQGLPLGAGSHGICERHRGQVYLGHRGRH